MQMGRSRKKEVLAVAGFGRFVSGLQPALEEIGDYILQFPPFIDGEQLHFPD
jgi:hypothetical protein